MSTDLPPPAFASAADALAAVRAGLGYLAAADPAAMTAQAQAECLLALEQHDAISTAARARILAPFTCTPSTWPDTFTGTSTGSPQLGSAQAFAALLLWLAPPSWTLRESRSPDG